MSERKAKILIIEDEAEIRRFLRISLEAHGYAVVESRFGEEGLAFCAKEHPDVVVLDLGLPDIDGQDALVRLREWSSVPVVVLSVRSDEQEKVTALDAGANDYVTKPFGISELLARIRALLRGAQAERDSLPQFHAGDITIDYVARTVSVAGNPVHLSRKEYKLLQLLARHAGQVLTHQQILDHVWGEDHRGDTHYLRVLVGHLRQKLGDQPAAPRYLVTEQGIGYRFIAE